MMKSTDPIKMVGPAKWAALSEVYRGGINRAILRGGNELVMDVECDGRVYSVKLKRGKGDSFHGEWERRSGRNLLNGLAVAVLYTSSAGQLLFGEWVEDETRYQWWAEVTTVKHFPDEAEPGTCA